MQSTWRDASYKQRICKAVARKDKTNRKQAARRAQDTSLPWNPQNPYDSPIPKSTISTPHATHMPQSPSPFQTPIPIRSAKEQEEQSLHMIDTFSTDEESSNNVIFISSCQRTLEPENNSIQPKLEVSFHMYYI